MTQITMYFKSYCPYCQRAKALLTEELKQKVNVIDLEKTPEHRDEMIKKSGGRTTVPQIFINDTHVGGCDDLMAAHASGKLKEMLGL